MFMHILKYNSLSSGCSFYSCILFLGRVCPSTGPELGSLLTGDLLKDFFLLKPLKTPGQGKELGEGVDSS